MAETMMAFGLRDEDATAGVLQLPVPEPVPGEIRVRMRASSVNGYDAFVASGMGRGMMEHRYPVVIGKDFAGVVDAVGEGVDRFAVGDEVSGVTPASMVVDERGSYAEFLVVPAGNFIERVPEGLTHEQAASVGLAAITALASVEHVAPTDGSTVLIVGATGGVGSYGVQLAAARGATVIATALPEDEQWIRGLGASETTDYSRDVVASVRERHADGIDGLIIAVQVGDELGALTDLVREDGAIASTVGGLDGDALAARGIASSNVFGQTDPALYGAVLDQVASGALTVPTTRTYGFDEIPEALGLVGKHHSRGKLSIRVE